MPGGFPGHYLGRPGVSASGHELLGLLPFRSVAGRRCWEGSRLPDKSLRTDDAAQAGDNGLRSHLVIAS